MAQTPQSLEGEKSMDFDGTSGEQLRNLHQDMLFAICKRVDDGWARRAWRYDSLTKTLTVELGRLFFADATDRENQIKVILILVNVGFVETLVLRRYLEYSCSRPDCCGGLPVEWTDWVISDHFRDLFDVLDRRLLRNVVIDSTSIGYLDGKPSIH